MQLRVVHVKFAQHPRHFAVFTLGAHSIYHVIAELAALPLLAFRYVDGIDLLSNGWMNQDASCLEEGSDSGGA